MDAELRALERRAAGGGLDDKAAFERARRRSGSPCELYDLVSENLLELAWRANYALSPNVAMLAFIGGFKARGFSVAQKGETLKIQARKILGGDNYKLTAFLKSDKILSGWANHPRGCPRSLYDSICETYDLLGRDFKGRAERDAWSEIRNGESIIVRRLMDAVLRESISELHEHAFLSASGEVSSGCPRIFYEVKERFPRRLYQRAKEVRAICGPEAACILEMEQSEFSDSYHPSVSAMLELFWGMYLDVLAREKGYPALNEESRLAGLISRGHEGLAPGRDIWPPRK